MNKIAFTVTVDKKQLNLAVVRPDEGALKEGQKRLNRAFREALDSGAVLRAKVESCMRDQNLWSDDKQREMEELSRQLVAGELKIRRGGIKKSEAHALALEIRKTRGKLRMVQAPKFELDNMTAEAQGENGRFNYFVSRCLVYDDTGKLYFKDLEDYLKNSTSEVAVEGANKLASLIYNLDNDYERKLPENAFLIKYGYMNDRLQLVNGEGHAVDDDGRLIDENGRYIKYDDGKALFVDKSGNVVDEKGNYLVEDEKPFLDDETGEPLHSSPAEENKG